VSASRYGTGQYRFAGGQFEKGRWILRRPKPENDIFGRGGFELSY